MSSRHTVVHHSHQLKTHIPVLDLRHALRTQYRQAVSANRHPGSVDIEILVPGGRYRLSLTLLSGEGQSKHSMPRPLDRPSAASRPSLDEAVSPEAMRTEEVFSAVNQALLNYHKLHRLTDSPLSQFLQIPHGNAGTTSPSGYSVRYLLDQAIDHISGVAAGEYLKPRTWHMEHYLHLRYRQKVQHKEIAGWLGYTERHLHRLRQELVQEVAQYIIQQAKMSGVS